MLSHNLRCCLLRRGPHCCITRVYIGGRANVSSLSWSHAKEIPFSFARHLKKVGCANNFAIRSKSAFGRKTIIPTRLRQNGWVNEAFAREKSPWKRPRDTFFTMGCAALLPHWTTSAEILLPWDAARKKASTNLNSCGLLVAQPSMCTKPHSRHYVRV